MALTFTQDQINALAAAIASGVLTVRYDTPGGGGRTVTYQSLDQMAAVLARMNALYEQQTTGQKSYSLAGFKSGV